MATPKKKKSTKSTKKRKGKIRVRTGAKVVKKDSVRNDTLPKVQGRPPANNAATLKLKIRRK